jgi:hypothetical protein
MPGVSVRRNMGDLSKLDTGRGRTLIFCGADTGPDRENDIRSLEAFVATGGRLAVLFYPLAREPRSCLDLEVECGDSVEDDKPCPKKVNAQDGSTAEPVKPKHSPSEKEEMKKKSRKPDDEEPWFAKMVMIGGRWGFSYAYSDPLPSAENAPAASRAEKNSGPEALPGSFSWHTVLYFDKLGPGWRVLYSRLGLPVVIERDYGKGTIALLSDSYLLSNEAMRAERQPGLLAWLVGPSPTVIFDEAHLGMEQPKGIMILMRRYRLAPLLLALLFLAGLFLWQNALSLVPKRTSMETPSTARGKDAGAGLINLLRRSISGRDVLSVCVEEWRRSLGRGDRESALTARISEIVKREKSLPPGRRDPARAYNLISRILAERSGRTWKTKSNT